MTPSTLPPALRRNANLPLLSFFFHSIAYILPGNRALRYADYEAPVSPPVVFPLAPILFVPIVFEPQTRYKFLRA
jgi:hypothetical protein